MLLVIRKAARRLLALDDDGGTMLSCPIALGSSPVGPKERAGDGKTPEGEYFVCVKKQGKYGPSLGVSYPNERDALHGLRSGLFVPPGLISLIREKAARGERPPWGTELGGEIYIHGGGTDTDWTAGCVALSDADAEKLYALVPLGTPIRIEP